MKRTRKIVCYIELMIFRHVLLATVLCQKRRGGNFPHVISHSLNHAGVLYEGRKGGGRGFT